MAVSQNGWPVDPARRARTIPGSSVRLTVADGPAGDVLMYVANQFDKRVEDIDLKSSRGELDDWGYANRPIRGGTSTSNHASATAVDFNATRHPLGARNTFTPAQRAEIHRILAEVDNVVRWGGDYTGRADEMHFEINATHARVAAVAARLSTNPPPATKGRILMTEDNMPTLPPAMTSSYEILAVPPDANVKLIFAAKTTIFGGHLYNWSPTPGAGTGGDPVNWRTEVKEGEAIPIPRGTSKVHIEYSCASPVNVFIQATT
ncbi:M15 family metallopeptidase [Amycolatopsis sp. cmx-11-51]|uniref:M15 family metallopeptidase n=1 Tax=Amycolatopsis sp. cmx-11-51 TaxID=2785797 RepID=UPI0039E39D0B